MNTQKLFPASPKTFFELDMKEFSISYLSGQMFIDKHIDLSQQFNAHVIIKFFDENQNMRGHKKLTHNDIVEFITLSNEGISEEDAQAATYQLFVTLLLGTEEEQTAIITQLAASYTYEIIPESPEE